MDDIPIKRHGYKFTCNRDTKLFERKMHIKVPQY